MDNISQENLEDKLPRAFQEFKVLYEVSAAMRTTLKLDHVLHIILTGVTSHSGLGYNRALLFLLNEKSDILECKMAVGPESGEDANRVWKDIETSNQKLEDMIKEEKLSQTINGSALFKTVSRLKVPVFTSENSLLKTAFERGTAWHLTPEETAAYSGDRLFEFFPTNELVIVPLKVKDKGIGLIIADNIYTQKPISKEDMRIFTLLANHAALAIENSRLYEMVVLKSQMDFLTDLGNHGFFQQKLTEEIQKARKSNASLSLVAIDIDNFKILNDTYGHQRGDLLLKQLAQIFKSLSRETDYVCRYGGEEFTILLGQTKNDQAYEIAERLRTCIENHDFIVPPDPTSGDSGIPQHVRLTVSIGLATFPGDASEKDGLIVQADKAMYIAKFSGKNKTCCSRN